MKLDDPAVVFFAVDPNLLCILIFYRKIFRFRYKVVSDWHMLFEDRRDSFVGKNSDALITTTAHLKSILIQRLRVPEKKILVAYGGVDARLFTDTADSPTTARTKLGLPANFFLVGYIGFYKTMRMSKGLDTMIDALAFIPDTDVKIVFVGGKPEEIDEYKSMAKEKGFADRVLFVPMVPASEVPAYEKAMDVLVVPYPDQPHFRDYGFPMKVYEYMASKKPIIYSDLPIISEVLGDCAMSFRPGDAKDLAEKILQIKSDPVRGGGLAAKAYDKVADYTWDKRAENIISFLKGI